MKGIIRCYLLILAVFSLSAQEPSGEPAGDSPEQSQPKTVHVDVKVSKEATEQAEFRKLLREPGTSAIDRVLALEEFLRKYPETKLRPEIERSLTQTALELKDRRRLIKHGEAVIQREPNNLRFVEHVIRAMLASDDKETSARALKYAERFEDSIRVLRLQVPQSGSDQAQFRMRTDAALAKALVYQARALGNLGRYEEAVQAARAGYEANPSAEAARESGRWLVKLGSDAEAIESYADAFAMSDPNTSARLRAKDRQKLKELYLKSHEAETGLGDLLLQAYDRTSKLLEQRHASYLALDPNLDAQQPLDFVLTGLNGEKLKMESLQGKVVVLDFWATWCKPCQVQQPLYEEVEAKYASNADVVFLNINTDKNRVAVQPFLEKADWDMTVYFEDGLQRLLEVSSIPTTVILDRHGDVASRLNGFLPEKFAEMLSERIDRVLGSD